MSQYEIERVAQAMAEATNGGDFYDGRWYSDEHRALWCKRAEVAHSVMSVMVDADLIEENRRLAAEVVKADGVTEYGNSGWDAGHALAVSIGITCTQLRSAKRRAGMDAETHEWLMGRLKRAVRRFERAADEYF